MPPSTPSEEMTNMIDESLARLRTYHDNIHRYRRLLETILTDHERSYIEMRLNEEEAAMKALTDAHRFHSPTCFPNDGVNAATCAAYGFGIAGRAIAGLGQGEEPEASGNEPRDGLVLAEFWPSTRSNRSP
jgi:hypothetical protein